MGPPVLGRPISPVKLSSIQDPPTTSDASRRLPPELISLILTFTEDWELSKTLNVRTTLPTPAPWVEFATPLDRAILRSSTSLNPVKFAKAHGHHTFTQWGARVMLRFGYVHVLDHFAHNDLRQLRQECKQLLPVVASAWGRTTVLEWAKDSLFGLKPDARTTAEAIDEASRHGQVEVLDFWKASGLPLNYSEAALDSASYKRQLGSLEWWKNSGLPLKIGYVLDFATMGGSSTVCLDWWANSGLPVRYSKAALYSLSKNGNIRLLDWWKRSRFNLVYDKEVLVNATRYGQTKVLDWWLNSGLDIEYRFFDIEEALEDSVANKEETQKWWEDLGYNSSLGANTWMKPRNLKAMRQGI